MTNTIFGVEEFEKRAESYQVVQSDVVRNVDVCVGPFVVPHVELQPRVAPDEEEVVEGRVVPESPGEAGHEYAQGHQAREAPLPLVPAPPQLEGHVTQDHRK